MNLESLKKYMNDNIAKESVDNIEESIAFCKNVISELEQERDELQKYSGTDELRIGRLTIQANYPSWNYWKSEAVYANPLYLGMSKGKNDHISMSLDLHDMKKLRDWLTDKLEFAEYE